MIRAAAILIATMAGFASLSPGATAETTHGLAMYGEPALPPDFQHLPFVNPDAPKGGRITFADLGVSTA